jgi:DNA mismatch repair protein MutS2
MTFEPKDVFTKLEFDKVLQLLEKHCLTEITAALVRELKPVTDFHTLDLLLKETRDMKLALEKNDRFPIATFAEIRDDLKLLSIEGYTLTADSFKQIVTVLYLVRDIFKYFSGQRKEIYPKLFDIIRALHFDENLIKAINTVFDDKGEIRPDASPELVRIRRETSNKQRELDVKFRQVVTDLRSKGLLSENPETFRNNRRVLSVPAEHKRKIKGIMHDESDTGRTCFIEPEAVVEINNDIFDLEMEERREIYKIMKDLSDRVRPYTGTLHGYMEMLIRFDFLSAKARLALSMKAGMPILKERPIIHIKKGYHPLLFLKNKALERKTIPFELKLNNENHILILSGPNAGGKSVAMKSVGLIQLMLQSGLLVPVHELSELGIFTQIFADIGDSQSLDDDLSTYSSRLKNAKIFLEKANPDTLVLIDEMGTGTDPKPGGAIAEGVLRQLHRKGVFGVMTTHYSNLKVFAFRNNGILNGNMHFDKDTLSPTYELKIGRPGSSYAFEIAHKSGLKKELIDYARQRTGNETAVDDILIELQKEKQELEEELRKVREREATLQKLQKSYDELNSDLDIRKKRFKLEQKEFELRQSANSQKEVEKLIKQLKEDKSVEKAREAVTQIRTERSNIVQKVDEIHASIVKAEENIPNASSPNPIEVGSFVRLRAGGIPGKIESMSGNKAIVQMGGLRITVAIRDLIPANEPLKQANTSTTTDLQYAASFDEKLDIRGMMKDEALLVLERFMDNALLSNAQTLRILHGKGNGILRTVVKQKLREYGGNIGKIYHPALNDGGDGVTVVELVG